MVDRAVSGRVALLALGLVAATVGGAVALGLLGTPEIVGVENRFGDVNRSTTVVETELLVYNPNPFGLQFVDTTVDYTVTMNDVAVAAGSESGLDVGRGTTTLRFTTPMDNREIPEWWATHVRNGERTTVTVNATARTSLLGNRTFTTVERKTVETDVIGGFNSEEVRPIEAPRALPLTSDPILYINRTSARWGRVTDAATPIDTAFVVYNPQRYPIPITELGYEVRMNGISVGAGGTDRTRLVPAGGTATVRSETVIRNDRLDEWWVTHLRNDQVTDLRIEFYALIDLPTGGTLRVSLDALTYEQTIETDVFGNENESAG